MKKLLVLSDVHYPVPLSMEYERIIASERPDNVLFLGDIVENSENGRNLLGLHKEFIARTRKLFDPKRTIYLLGDNDYQNRREVLEYVKSMGFMNRDFFRFSAGNMFFFHGNLEKNHVVEIMGAEFMRFFYPIDRLFAPKVLMGLIGIVYNTGDKYKFAGHIHMLEKLEGSRGVFCGTLNRNRIIYGPGESLGYVTIKHDGFVIKSLADVRLVRLNPVAAASTRNST